MEEKILKGRTVNLKFLLDEEENKLKFLFCGLDEIPKETNSVPFLFNEILSTLAEIISNSDKEAIIEYSNKAIFNLETCISAYLIDFINSKNDISEINNEVLETIYENESVNDLFNSINFNTEEIEEFFKAENSALSIIHDAINSFVTV